MKLNFLLVTALFSTAAFAGDYANVAEGVEVVRVIDGDTVVVNVAGWPDIIGKKMSVRLANIDTPEMNGRCEAEKILAQLAKASLELKLKNCGRVVLLDLERDSFFRIVADVRCAEGIGYRSLGAELLVDKLAVPYADRKSHGWCK